MHEDRIHLPMTKNGRAFDLPIVTRHLEILEPVRGLNKKWVFPSNKSETGYIGRPVRLRWSPTRTAGPSRPWPWRLGVLEEIVGRLLNHTPKSITGQRYTKPSLDALRPAMHTVIEELVSRGALR